MPLTKEARRWEAGAASISSMPLASGPGPRSTEQKAGDDYADEAGYSRPRFLRQPPRNEDRNPPIIQEHHVWGVTDEWGGKAGRWGKGAKAFEGDDPDRKKGG